VAELERFLPPPTDSKPGCETLVVSDGTDVGAAVRASCAVPGVFQPVQIQGMRLVDGGVMCQVPVDVVRAMGADITVGIGLGMPYYPRHFGGVGSTVAAQIAAIGIAQNRRSLDLADIGFRVEGIDEHSAVHVHQGRLEDLGERAMTVRLELLRELVRGNG
jgi:NTE family protein